MKLQLELTEEPGREPSFEATAEELWSSFIANAGHRPLAPEELSREAIYDDHD